MDHDYRNDYMPHVTGLSELVNLEHGYSKSIDIIITRTKNFLRSFLKRDKPDVSSKLNNIVDTNCVRRLVMVGDRLIRKRLVPQLMLVPPFANANTDVCLC